jgi:hypothetical protein
MADIPQVLATYAALVGVALGAGLTYGFSVLNRRHQEAREDKTRWYEARREAYAALLIATSRVSQGIRDAAEKPERPMSDPPDDLLSAMGAVSLVGSPQVIEAADNLFNSILEDVELHGQELFELVRRQVEKGEITAEDMDLVEEALEKFSTARPIHMPAARVAFEEAARKDLGHPSP